MPVAALLLMFISCWRIRSVCRWTQFERAYTTTTTNWVAEEGGGNLSFAQRLTVRHQTLDYGQLSEFHSERHNKMHIDV